MNIEFSEHAKQQLTRRSISQQLVREVMLNPDEIIPTFRKRELLRAQIGGKLLEVVTKKEGLKIIVITAYYLKE